MKKFALILGLCLWGLAAAAEKITITETSDVEYSEHIKNRSKSLRIFLKPIILMSITFPSFIYEIIISYYDT